MRTTRVRTTLIAGLAGVLSVAVLAGCGTAGALGDETPDDASAGASSPSSVAAAPDPCTLLSDNEASALLHRAARAKDRDKPEDFRGNECEFETDGAEYLTVEVYTGRNYFNPGMQGPDGHRLTGVADDAYTDSAGEIAGAVAGDTVLVVNASGPDRAGEAALRETVARVPR